MKLLCLSVENFGVLHEFHIDLTDGLNVFCRENGAGKTTLAAFLCAMLYGLPVSRKNDIAENDRKKYRPWQGGVFGGSITFSVREKTYRAERRFDAGASAKNDTFALYDLSDNSRSDDYSENLGYELFGIDAAAFERSIYLPQKLLSGERTNESITARLNRAIVGDGDDGAGLYKTAAAVLDRQRQYYAKQGGRGFIADLETRIAQLHEKEYAALRAKEDAERYAADAAALGEEIAALRIKRKTHGEEQKAAAARSAILAHGRSLLEARDARLASAAQKRQFLHLDDEDGIREGRFGDAAVRAAKEAEAEYQRQTDRLDAAEAQIQRIGEEQTALSAQFVGGIPDDETEAEIASAVSLLSAENAARGSCAASLPACFSEEELSRHTEQAQMHVRMTEILDRPKTAEEAYRAACAEAGTEQGDDLPDDDTLQAYADVLGALAQNSEKQKQLLPQIEETGAAMAAFTAGHPSVADQQEIVAMRSRFDALRSRTEEIEELEARQRLAVQVHENLRRSRRIRIGVGAALLLAAALLCAGSFLLTDLRLLIAGGVTALPGLILLILGLFTHPEESDEAMALEDAAMKRLCTKKSEYEVEKSAIYEFLDRIGGDADAVLDVREAAERFAQAAATAREREALSERERMLAGQMDALLLEETRLLAVRSSYTKSGGGEIVDIGDDREAFSAYRRTVQTCRTAYEACKEERETRAQAQARKQALELALDRYLAELDEACPTEAQRCGDTEGGTYSARMTAWCRTADLLRMQMGEMSRLAEQRKAAETALSARIDALLSDTVVSDSAVSDDGLADGGVLDRAQKVLSLCGRYRVIADERAALAEQRSTLRGQTEQLQQNLQAFLEGYFDEPYPTAAEGMQIIAEQTAALSSDMELLREAQRTLGVFLSEHGMTEGSLMQALAAAQTPDTDAVQAGSDLDAALDDKTALRAKVLQDAEQASRAGSALSEIRGQLARTEETLSQAKNALAVIRLTQQTLDEAKTAMSTRYLAYMQARIREYWSRMNGADAEKLSLDASFAVQTEVFGERRDAAFFSRGTQDCIEFCVRLALIDAMFTDGGKKTDAPHPPILLDDPFVNLDASHLAAARRLLYEISDRFQILYFVCHESRA